MPAALADLAEHLRAGGGLVGSVVADAAPEADDRLGPAVAGRGAEYPFVVEAVREGHLLHYGRGRVVQSDDPDLALLAGDLLYALGLARLAELGDLHAVGVLADVISACAQAHAEGRDGDADGIWESGARAIADGAGR